MDRLLAIKILHELFLQNHRNWEWVGVGVGGGGGGLLGDVVVRVGGGKGR